MERILAKARFDQHESKIEEGPSMSEPLTDLRDGFESRFTRFAQGVLMHAIEHSDTFLSFLEDFFDSPCKKHAHCDCSTP